MSGRKEPNQTNKQSKNVEIKSKTSNLISFQNKYCSRLMRAMSTMARREGKDGALHFFSFQEQADVSNIGPDRL